MLQHQHPPIGVDQDIMYAWHSLLLTMLFTSNNATMALNEAGCERVAQIRAIVPGLEHAAKTPNIAQNATIQQIYNVLGRAASDLSSVGNDLFALYEEIGDANKVARDNAKTAITQKETNQRVGSFASIN